MILYNIARAVLALDTPDFLRAIKQLEKEVGSDFCTDSKNHKNW